MLCFYDDSEKHNWNRKASILNFYGKMIVVLVSKFVSAVLYLHLRTLPNFSQATSVYILLACLASEKK